MAQTQMDDKKSLYRDGIQVAAITTAYDADSEPQGDEQLATTHHGEFGTRRDLKPRHVSMIALAGTVSGC